MEKYPNPLVAEGESVSLIVRTLVRTFKFQNLTISSGEILLSNDIRRINFVCYDQNVKNIFKLLISVVNGR